MSSRSSARIVGLTGPCLSAEAVLDPHPRLLMSTILMLRWRTRTTTATTHPCAAELTRMILIQKPPIQGVP
jgi:hypothetical protein